MFSQRATSFEGMASDAGLVLPTSEPVLTLEAQMVLRSPVGMALIDHEGLYLSTNPAYCALYGYTADELLGRPFTMILPLPQREILLAMHRQFVAGRGEMNGEWEVLCRDGTLRNVMLESVRVPGNDGLIARLATVVDITPHRQLEQSLHQSRQFLHSVLDGIAAHVCVLDEAGRIITVNRAWRDYAHAQDALADGVFEGASYVSVCERAACTASKDATQAAAFLSLLKDVLAGQRAQFQFEYPCHSPSEQRWFLASVARIAGSQPARIVVAHDDVTAIKRAQETLHESEALLRDLAASIPGAMFRMVRRPGGEWHYVYLSPGVTALFEVTPEQVYADDPLLRRQLLPEDREGLRASVAEAEARNGAWVHEFRIRNPSGALKWIQAQAAPKPGSDGSLVWTGVYTDISDRKRVEAVLQASEETYRTLFETVPQGVIYHDTTGQITSANPAAQRILGLTLEQLQGRSSVDPRWQVVHEDGSPFAGDQFPTMVALRRGQAVHDVVMGVKRPDDGTVWIQVNAIPLFKQGRLHEVYASFEDITQRVQLSRELRVQAATDYLTGAANRRSLMERVQTEYLRVLRHPDIRCCVLALDLDHFKQVNDALGHAAGDAVLVHLTRLMRQETRALDVVGRSGGEEFTLLLPDTGIDEAMALAERLRARVAATPAAFGGQVIGFTISIGASRMLPGDASADAVLGRADHALYAAKHAGRNAVRQA